MSEKITAMIEEIKGLSVLELSELVHALEDPSVSPQQQSPLPQPAQPQQPSKRRPSSTSS